MDNDAKNFFSQIANNRNSTPPKIMDIDEEISLANAAQTDSAPIAELAKSPASAPASSKSKSKPKLSQTSKPSKKADKVELHESNDQDDFIFSGGDAEGQLTVDVFETPREIIIQSTVAGVTPDHLHVDINSELVAIRGERQRDREVKSEDFYYQECYWGKFSRSIILPQEIDPDKAEAKLKDGILTITMPKLNRDKVKRVEIKSS